jgi:ubiquinone biosynthesis protein
VVQSVARLLQWVRGGSLFAFGVAWDWLRRRNTQENRARRLREAFEAMGTTFIKLGQQLSMRLDLLPYAYTSELEKMLDKVPPFPTGEAIRTIERATSQPLGKHFSAFDPEPIGSASVACVYQAVLGSGETVAVKVRRPGIVPLLAADMRALGWLLEIAELLFLPPGFSENFIFELRTMLMEELDFTREARFADLYRRRMRKTKQLRYVSVPRVFFDHSNDEVLISEFVSGVWLTEILLALETRNRQALDNLQEMNIDPVILARRIQVIARFNNFEHIFFHADLHPANILIQPGNKIVLIDFGSCGSFSKKELISWRRWFDAQSTNDVGGMVQAALAIIEPLPPIDRDEFAMKLESMFWTDLYAIKSRHSEWWERISARLWMGFLKLSREHQIPMRLNTLRMIRASMLSDTIAARLDNDQDPYREFRYYEKGAGRRAKKRIKKRLHNLVGPSKYIRIEQGIESAIKFVYQLQRGVDTLTSIRLGAIVAKSAYAVILLLRLLITVSISTGALVAARWSFGWFGWFKLTKSTPLQILTDVLGNGYFQIYVLVLALITLRFLFHRLHHTDPP